MFKALVTDTDTPFDADNQYVFKDKVETFTAEKFDENYLVENIQDCNALCSVFIFAKITGKIIQAGKDLKVIARYGVGVDNIDVEKATEKGIVVTNCPEYHLPSMPEHVLALMFALARNIIKGDKHVRQGQWNHQAVLGTDLEGKTLGILGFGRIGAVLSHKAIGLGMKIVVYDPYLTSEQAKLNCVKKADFDEVVKEADFLSVNVPLTEKTKGLVNRKTFDKMKETAYLINTARGPIVDEDALYDVLQSKRIAGAALDVMTKEPPAKDHPFFDLDNVIITPHCGGSTKEAFQRIGATAARSIVDVLEGRRPKYICNPEVLTKLNLK